VCLYANVRTEKVDEFTKIMSAMSSKELWITMVITFANESKWCIKFWFWNLNIFPLFFEHNFVSLDSACILMINKRILTEYYYFVFLLKDSNQYDNYNDEQMPAKCTRVDQAVTTNSNSDTQLGRTQKHEKWDCFGKHD
jgi:hypothetical protein